MITDIVEAIFSIIKEIPEMIDAFSGMELSSSSELLPRALKLQPLPN
ncbi:hypothetical protein [Corynebacterium camporealensis]|nr:hypothetical protein [Corynebacterium camporealensis]